MADIDNSHDNIVVIGGGASCLEYGLPKTLRFAYGRALLIGINDSGYYLQTDIVLSMDRLFIEARYGHCGKYTKYVFRKSAAKNIRPLHDDVRYFENDNTLPEFAEMQEPLVLNGRHSGFCALNMAYLMRPRNLYLLGFDCRLNPKSGREYWYPDYPWTRKDLEKEKRKLRGWLSDYDYAAEKFRAIGVNVFNVNHCTDIVAFERISFAQFLEQVGAQ